MRVADAGGLSATQAFEVEVAEANDAPSIVSSPVTVAVEDEAYAYEVDAFDPDAGDVLTFSLTAAPAGMAIDAARGTPREYK